ncbi:hypothetical protein K505DRAFT_368535 [Melanomma pulvis-pyrius CBS 109.77]|uniref:Protein kinase domain-containing protein n=1 Tax=Melanomma pulvis-pyrius CBS 109.77 TaxID=1314802 RepID=A0A6A6WPP8_9PLEO|nr:hypothetical protein K505DRAFT_368535 [Melanomma pulvis-pyrius CBS 109.77]
MNWFNGEESIVGRLLGCHSWALEQSQVAATELARARGAGQEAGPGNQIAKMDCTAFHVFALHSSMLYPISPDGVQHIVTTGGNHYIGFVNESTILKYPHFKGTRGALGVELEILQRLGKHPHIIELKGEHEDGLLLEYALIYHRK